MSEIESLRAEIAGLRADLRKAVGAAYRAFSPDDGVPVFGGTPTMLPIGMDVPAGRVVPEGVVSHEIAR